MKIFLLDTGISEKYKSKCNNIIRVNPQAGYDCDGHGTQVLSVIDTHLEGQTVYVYKINFLTNREQTYKNVVKGLNLAAEYKPDVVSMSVGIRAEFDTSLEDVIRTLTNSGILVVAAADNAGALCSPARFADVLSVIWDSSIVRTSEFEVINHEYIDLIGYGGTLQVNNGLGYETVGGSSFLVPLLIVYISNNFQTIPSKKQILDHFRKKKINNYCLDASLDNVSIGEIRKAVLFPVNKEIITILNNIDLVPFQVSSVYDVRFSTNVGKKIKELLYQKKINSYFFEKEDIQTLENLNWDGEFDTIIVGHVKKLSKLYKFDFLNFIRNKAEKCGKKVFALDDVKNPSYSFCYKNNVAFGALNAFKTPVIAVVGTGASQGKASLQLSLHREFILSGYKSSVFMTEPYYELFGFSGWINGYATNQNNWKYEILSINKIFRNVDKEKKDIVIVGTQSHILPSSRNNLGFIPQESQDVLNAIPPDGFILTISPETPLKYVERTCKYLESYYNVPVLAKYSIFPTKLECYGPSDVKKLTEMIVKYFSVRSYYGN